jgi:hypothetical protein
MGPVLWYASVALRWVVALFLLWVVEQWVNTRAWPWAVKIVLSVVAIGVIGGILVIGPLSYRSYLKAPEDFERIRRRFEEQERKKRNVAR